MAPMAESIGYSFSRRKEGDCNNLVLILIESFPRDRLISGKSCSAKELEERFRQVLKLAGEKDFADVFCRMYGFEEYLMEKDIPVDFVIDLDTHLLYRPRY